MEKHFEPAFVESLFDRMSESYDRMNYITSFGFSEYWRKQCVWRATFPPNAVVVDLLAGMGECWHYILKKAGPDVQLIGLDFSGEMVRHSQSRRKKLGASQIQILQENVFDNSLPDNSADVIISGFGMKTFSPEQLKNLAKEIHRILKPGGNFSLVDVSVPGSPFLRFFYMFYLKRIIPFLGRLFLGDPETYKMLGTYTESFGNAREIAEGFRETGLEVTYSEYFFGCASGLTGTKPE